jgi:hypothetical protein
MGQRQARSIESPEILFTGTGKWKRLDLRALTQPTAIHLAGLVTPPPWPSDEEMNSEDLLTAICTE